MSRRDNAFIVALSMLGMGVFCFILVIAGNFIGFPMECTFVLGTACFIGGLILLAILRGTRKRP